MKKESWTITNEYGVFWLSAVQSEDGTFGYWAQPAGVNEMSFSSVSLLAALKKCLRRRGVVLA